MGFRHLSKEERRGILILMLSLLVLLGVVIIKELSPQHEDVYIKETETTYKELLIQQNDSVEAQFDSIAVMQKQSTKKIRQKQSKKDKKEQKVYPTRDFHSQPITTR